MLHIETSDTPDQVKEAVEAAGLTFAGTQEEETGEAGDAAGETPTENSAPTVEAGESAGAAPGESEGETEPPAGEQEQTGGERRKPGSQRERERRIAAETENAELKRQLAEAQSKAGGDAGKKTDPATETPKPEAAGAKPKPKLSDFQDAEDPVEAFTEALTEWKLDERDRKAAESNAQRQANDAATAKRRAWDDAEAKIRGEHADYEERLNSVEISAVMAHVLAEDAATGPELAYLLATNPEETAKIVEATTLPSNASPAAKRQAAFTAARMIGALQVQKANASTPVKESAPPAQQTSKPQAKAQPKPPTRVSGGAAPSSSGSIDYDKIAASDNPIAAFEAAQRKRA